jgi:hypothetical protein
MLQNGIRALAFKTDPGWAKQVELELNFHRELILKCPNLKLQSIHGKN